MEHRHLALYLNDHLAGSELALELLERLEKTYADRALGRFFSDLHADIHEDRQELERLIGQLHITESLPRKVTAWFGEKVSFLKLSLDDASDGTFRLLESLEVLSLGIEGKRGLWQALAATAEALPELAILDYVDLIQRAQEQRARVEQQRVAAATQAFRQDS